MSDPTFETRLRARMHDVLDSEVGPHPSWADAPAARPTPDRRRRGSWPIRLLAVAALLAIAGGTLSIAGSWKPTPEQSAPPVQAPQIPGVLRGQFMAQLAIPNGYPFYFVDLEDAILIHGPGTSPDPATVRAEPRTSVGWAGRVVQFTPAGAGAATIVIQAPPPCGEGHYLVRYDEVERRGDAQAWTLTFTQPQDSCADRVAILAGRSDDPTTAVSASPDGSAASNPAASGRVWTHQPTGLLAGERYASWSFTEPFHFQVPAEVQVPWSPPLAAWPWLAPGRLRMGNVWWRGEFYDDKALRIDNCDPRVGSLPDIPASPQAFESWLTSTGRSIERSAAIPVAGRTAMRYDTSEPNCPDPEPNTFFGRWYLIPTGDDTILFNVYGDTETELQLADDIVRSMTFD